MLLFQVVQYIRYEATKCGRLLQFTSIAVGGVLCRFRQHEYRIYPGCQELSFDLIETVGCIYIIMPSMKPEDQVHLVFWRQVAGDDQQHRTVPVMVPGRIENT